MAENWGAKRRMNFNERDLALEQGVVDGQENPAAMIKAGKRYQVEDYTIQTGHIMTPRLVVVNEDFWQSRRRRTSRSGKMPAAEAATWSNARP